MGSVPFVTRRTATATRHAPRSPGAGQQNLSQDELGRVAKVPTSTIFSSTIALDLPDEAGRLAMLRLHSARVPTVGVGLDEVARARWALVG